MSEEYIIPSIKKYKIFELIIQGQKFNLYCKNLKDIKKVVKTKIPNIKDIQLNYVYSTDKKSEAEKLAVNIKEFELKNLKT
jgi:hypothetical protein